MRAYSDVVIHYSGVPLGGCQIYVYIAGTTTLASIYSTNSTSNVLANPFNNNNDGSYQFYAKNGRYAIVPVRSGYTFNLPDSADVLLYDPEDVILNATDFGAKGDGTTDDTAAITAMFNALNAAGSISLKKLIFSPGGQYVITSALPAITVSDWVIEGYGARILMNGTTAYTAMQFGYNNPTTNRLTHVALKGIAIIKNNATGGTCIKCVGWSSYSSMEDVLIFAGYHGTNGDKGLYFVGTNETAITNLSVVADKPVVLGNATGTSGDGVDQVNFHNLDLYSTTNANPLISMDLGATWGNLSFTGNQIWIGGNAGFQYNDAGQTANNGNITFENIRREDNTVAAPPHASGYSIDIQSPAAYSTQLVSIRNSQLSLGTAVNGTAMNGIRLHSGNVRLLVDSYFDGGSTGQTVLEVTGQNNAFDDITLTNFNQGSGTVSFTNTKGARPIQVAGISGTATKSTNLRGSATFASAATKVVSFGSAEPDASYFVSISGSANETFWVTAKGTGGFTLNSSNATSTATVDWHLIR